MWYVTIAINGQVYWLRGTVFTASQDRATLYATKDEAQAALTSAAKFFRRKSQIRDCKIEAALPG